MSVLYYFPLLRKNAVHKCKSGLLAVKKMAQAVLTVNKRRCQNDGTRLLRPSALREAHRCIIIRV